MCVSACLYVCASAPPGSPDVPEQPQRPVRLMHLFLLDSQARFGVAAAALASPAAHARAQALAVRFGMPHVPAPFDVAAATVTPTLPDFVVVVSDDGCLRLVDTQRRVIQLPFQLHQAASARTDREGGQLPGVVRAVCGRGSAAGRTVLDCTGGAGVDAMTLARHGCSVHVVERNPVFACLLEHEIERFNAEVAAGTPQRQRSLLPMRFTFGDASAVLRDPVSHRPQV